MGARFESVGYRRARRFVGWDGGLVFGGWFGIVWEEKRGERLRARWPGLLQLTSAVAQVLRYLIGLSRGQAVLLLSTMYLGMYSTGRLKQ